MAKKGQVTRKWVLVDATDKSLGRLAARVSLVLQGKNKPIYTPHVDTGDFVVVTNAEKVKLTGRKREQKVYQKYTHFPGGLKEVTAEEMAAKKPEEIIRLAVRRMVPKTKLGVAMFKKLKVYCGPDHPHAAQNPEAIAL